jgi:NADH:ubiquinone oxidoreductase subunit F (NADH-binding)
MSRIRAAGTARLLGGPSLDQGAESFAAHQARLGARPAGRLELIGELKASGLTGRGGAGFPAWRKWAVVAERARGRAKLVVNASEGEPASRKDQTLLRHRPHLVLDGVQLAAETIGASEGIVYLSRAFDEQRRALEQAIAERRNADADSVRVHVVTCPHRYIAGEASAVVNGINTGVAKPIAVPPRPFERGVDGRPTLVQNTETIAHTALISRFGASWFRSAGTQASPGTALITVSGAVVSPGVYEIPMGVTVEQAIACAGGATEAPQAILLGGYFGTWLPATCLPTLHLDRHELQAAGTSFGCGVIAVLPHSRCGLYEAASVLSYLAAESAGQCGPCVFGLRSVASTMTRIAQGLGHHADQALLRRWDKEIRGRGECHHPDGALRHLQSAIATFAADLDSHLAGAPCAGARWQTPMLPVPTASLEEWVG